MAPRDPHPCATHLGLEPLCPLCHPPSSEATPSLYHPPGAVAASFRWSGLPKKSVSGCGKQKAGMELALEHLHSQLPLGEGQTTAGSSLGKAQAPQGTSEGSRSQMQMLQEGPAAWECKWDSNLWGRQNVRLVWGFTHKQGLAAEPWRGAVPGNHPCFSWSPRMPRVGSFQSSFSKLLSHRAQIQLF